MPSMIGHNECMHTLHSAYDAVYLQCTRCQILYLLNCNTFYQAYVPPSPANGIILETITATSESVALDDGLVAMTINLEFNPIDCGHDFVLFTAETTNASYSGLNTRITKPIDSVIHVRLICTLRDTRGVSR